MLGPCGALAGFVGFLLDPCWVLAGIKLHQCHVTRSCRDRPLSVSTKIILLPYWVRQSYVQLHQLNETKCPQEHNKEPKMKSEKACIRRSTSAKVSDTILNYMLDVPLFENLFVGMSKSIHCDDLSTFLTLSSLVNTPLCKLRHYCVSSLAM